ncbi:MAG: DUF4097 domain-containing protein [Candidatus Eremiobacteraeota bacterium]|nr:DUF4097 domain-containing protein [Candidatus Eremiobacteraeota bacterium]
MTVALLAGLVGGVRLPARATQTVKIGPSSLVTIRSSAGTITIQSSDGDVVRLDSDAATLSRFITRPADGRVTLPRARRRRLTGTGWQSLRLPARVFSIPNVHGGADGVTIVNPGGDMAVWLPRGVRTVFVNAGSGSVIMERMRGAYVIASNGGDVLLRNVFGHGVVRTLDGAVNLIAVGGNVHVETAAGNIVARSCDVGRADVRTQSGDIDWDFGRIGMGAYHFRSGSGNVRLGLPPDARADVDAESELNSVINSMPAVGAGVRFVSQHALSLTVGGGGPQITATSRRGTVSLGPRARPQTP